MRQSIESAARGLVRVLVGWGRSVVAWAEGTVAPVAPPRVRVPVSSRPPVYTVGGGESVAVSLPVGCRSAGRVGTVAMLGPVRIPVRPRQPDPIRDTAAVPLSAIRAELAKALRAAELKVQAERAGRTVTVRPAARVPLPVLSAPIPLPCTTVAPVPPAPASVAEPPAAEPVPVKPARKPRKTKAQKGREIAEALGLIEPAAPPMPAAESRTAPPKRSRRKSQPAPAAPSRISYLHGQRPADAPEPMPWRAGCGPKLESHAAESTRLVWGTASGELEYHRTQHALGRPVDAEALFAIIEDLLAESGQAERELEQIGEMVLGHRCVDAGEIREEIGNRREAHADELREVRSMVRDEEKPERVVKYITDRLVDMGEEKPEPAATV